MKLTRSLIESLPQPDKGQKIYRDQIIIGFAIRLTPTARSYVVEGKVRNVRKRITIGRVGDITIDTARHEARRLLSEMGNGVDPRPQKALSPTLEIAMERFLLCRRMKESSKEHVRRLVRRSMSDWLNLPLDQISKEMVIQRHTELGNTITRCKTDNKTSANYVFRRLRSIIKFAREVYQTEGKPIISEDPTQCLGWRWYETKVRVGLIPDHRLAEFYKLLMHSTRKDCRDFIFILLFTALRRRETSMLKWEDIDFKQKILRIPASSTKTGKEHILPITPIVMAILESRRHNCSEYVFPGRDGGCLNEPRMTLHHLRKAMGWHWLLHDLRRTALSAADKSGLPYIAIAKIANHSYRRGMSDRYIVVDEEYIRPFLEAMNNRLLDLMRTSVEQWAAEDKASRPKKFIATEQQLAEGENSEEKGDLEVAEPKAEAMEEEEEEIYF